MALIVFAGIVKLALPSFWALRVVRYHMSDPLYETYVLYSY